MDEQIEKAMGENREYMETKMEENREYMENNMEENMKQIKKKMDENWEHMEKKIEELQKSMSTMFLQSPYERLHKGYIKMQENNENVEEIKIEPQNCDYSSIQNPHH